MNDLRAGLIDACTAAGWSWNSSDQELSSGTAVVKIELLGGGEHIQFVGRTASGASPAARLGRISGHPSWALSWPMAYSIHVWPTEVYVVAVYDVDKHLWAAFGRSTVAGISGSGTWVGATLGVGTFAGPAPIDIEAGRGGGSYAYPVTPALFHSNFALMSDSRNCWVDHGMDGNGWLWGSSVDAAPAGAAATASPLLGLLPNTWNSEAVLLPLRAYLRRPSNKISMIVDCEYARITRVDNYSPGQVISIGSDRWRVYPWLRKNAAERNGGSNGLTHTGTFGWALRYEGQ